MDSYRALLPMAEVLCDPSETPASTNNKDANKEDENKKQAAIAAVLAHKNESEFGRLALQDLKKLKFYTTDYANDNKHLNKINKHYQIVDVLGDGNC